MQFNRLHKVKIEIKDTQKYHNTYKRNIMGNYSFFQKRNKSLNKNHSEEAILLRTCYH